MKSYCLLVVIMAACFLNALPVSHPGDIASQRARYEVTDLGILSRFPDYQKSIARSLNDRGEAVGEVFRAGGIEGNNETGLKYNAQTIFWFRDGRMTDPGVPDTWSAEACAINAKGQIAGAAHQLSNFQAALWESGQMRLLGALGGSSLAYSMAYGLNNRGQVVGMSTTDVPGVHHAFLWQDGKMTDLGSFAGKMGLSSAQAVNDRGQIVGTAELSPPGRAAGQNPQIGGNGKKPAPGVRGRPSSIRGPMHAFLWEDGRMTDLGTLVTEPRGSSGAYGVNNKGQIVGMSDMEAFVWEKGTMRRLPSFSGEWSRANAINDKGQIVGVCGLKNPPPEPYERRHHACLYDRGKMLDLNSMIPATSGWELLEATSINTRGQIVGYGWWNNGLRAFLLTPITP